MNNYPPGMDWQAFDDYTDPVVDCCERRASNCECPECDNCGRIYNEDHDWEEIPDSTDVVCSDCYVAYEEEMEYEKEEREYELAMEKEKEK